MKEMKRKKRAFIPIRRGNTARSHISEGIAQLFTLRDAAHNKANDDIQHHRHVWAQNHSIN